MSKPSAQEVRDALQINVDKASSEGAQRNAVIRALHMLGHTRPPQITSGKLDGDTIKLYLWEKTPAGDIILATGPAFLPKIFQPSDIAHQGGGIYILAGKDKTKATEQASAYAAAYKPRGGGSPARAAERVAAPRVPRTREKAASAAAVRAPAHAPAQAARSTEAAERAELQNALAALLG